MRVGEVESALEKRQLWEISKIKRHSFKHINPSKPQYIMLDPPQLSCLLVISTEGHMCYHGPTYSDQGYIPVCLWHCNFQQFERARLNTVHFSPWRHMTVVTR